MISAFKEKNCAFVLARQQSAKLLSVMKLFSSSFVLTVHFYLIDNALKTAMATLRAPQAVPLSNSIRARQPKAIIPLCMNCQEVVTSSTPLQTLDSLGRRMQKLPWFPTPIQTAKMMASVNTQPTSTRRPRRHILWMVILYHLDHARRAHHRYIVAVYVLRCLNRRRTRIACKVALIPAETSIKSWCLQPESRAALIFAILKAKRPQASPNADMCRPEQRTQRERRSYRVTYHTGAYFELARENQGY